MRYQSVWIHYLLLFTGVLCISWSAIFVKLAGVSGLTSAFYRMFFASIGIIPFWLVFRKPLQETRGLKIAMLCGVIFACDIALWNTSIMLIKASISTLLANMAPVWVGLGAFLFMKEKPGRVFWWGASLALLGVVLVMGFAELVTARLNLGSVLSVVASMFYGAYILTVRKGRNSLDTFTFTAVSMITSTLVLGVLCWAADVPLAGFSAQSWWALVGLGLIPQLLGWLAINQALGYILPTVASVSLLMQSVITAFLSAWVLGESLTFVEILGAVVVLLGIYLVNKKTSLSEK